MNVLGVISGALKLVNVVARMFSRRQLMRAGASEAAAESQNGRLKRSSWLRALLILLVTILITAGGCKSDSVVPTEYCLIAEPISFSDADTAETRRQIDEHNARWACVCDAQC